MAELRYRAGKIRDPGVHKIGIIALGSHLENHGPALPIDTDAKIGAHIAFQSSLKTGAKFLGIINSWILKKSLLLMLMEETFL